MWHPIARVVETRKLDPASALYVALERTDEFGIIDTGDVMEISTWHVNAFVEAVRKFKTEVDGDNELI